MLADEPNGVSRCLDETDRSSAQGWMRAESASTSCTSTASTRCASTNGNHGRCVKNAGQFTLAFSGALFPTTKAKRWSGFFRSTLRRFAANRQKRLAAYASPVEAEEAYNLSLALFARAT
ncbi:hypothetical protein [Burkholderia cepacia]|uniref:hypothetical protein n=1 Tax=Burkholderia cepacia TaxID=292 RepID=UPI0012D95EE4|nr:hypothetical protein [Burkholderia cepacia]